MPLVTNTSLTALGEILAAHDRFVIASHVRPDGDAVGSALGLALSLRAAGKQARVVLHDPVPENLRFLPGTETVIQPPTALGAPSEVALALDTATYERLGLGVTGVYDGAPILLNLDHHISNPGYGTHHYIDSDSPATGQIITQLILANDLPLPRDAAENLYAAISTDTGSFQYDSTTAETYRLIARLVETGLHIGELNRKLYQSFPLRRLRLLGELLQALRITADGRCASWALSREMIGRAGSTPDDSENLIDHLRAIEGVVVAAFLEELGDGKVRVSLRSKDPRVNVSALAAKFGGGGHILASGARLSGPLDQAHERLLSALHEALQAL
jgi:bifunctional oligoribonuclease and PAP phosphatase NrnA